MAVLDFPASPLAGDKYPVPAVAGQPQYTYDGVKWTTIGAQISNAAPATALPLMDAATAVVGTATKYAREDHVHPRVPAAPIDALGWSGMQINGSMEVSQEKGTAITTSTGYIIDGWTTFLSISPAVVNMYQATDSVALGLPKCINVTVSTAKPSLAAGDVCYVATVIEGYRIARLAFGFALAQPITIGFWTAHHRTGTHTGTVQNSGQSRAYAFSYTQNASDNWEYHTVTVPGDVAGTWNNDNRVGMYIYFAVAVGSTYTAPSLNTWLSQNYVAGPGQQNCIAATSDIFRLTGVVVLPGIAAPTAAQSPLIMRPYDQELLTCQRYWQTKTSVTYYGALRMANDNYRILSVMLTPTMRANPTCTAFGKVDGGGIIALVTEPASTHGFNVVYSMGNTTSILTVSSWLADARL